MLSDLLQNDAGLPASGDLPISGVTSDSRLVRQGFLFAALSGTKVDGADFIAQAMANGASAVICQTGTKPPGFHAIETENPHRLLAYVAARFYDRQPRHIVAVTGTNGKTSVAVFVRQIWASMGYRAASLGTIGLVGPEGTEILEHTTPGPVQMQELVAKLSDQDIQYLALEASSHGLSQFRLDGLHLIAGAFTNITHDHLDYHETFAAYFTAKMRLFDELLLPGGAAVINMDSPHGALVLKHATDRELLPFTVGRAGQNLQLKSVIRNGMGQILKIATPTDAYEVHLPLVGEFQASNALVAAGLVIVSGGNESSAINVLQALQGASGRLDLVGTSPSGASIFVDYAHTPDALENALAALRPYVENKLLVVFGCGGDRDKSKRPLMGHIAQQLADRVFVTDDNPRWEDAAVIRAEIMVGTTSALEIGDRALAISTAIHELGKGDILLVAGKGHEVGQKIGATALPFSDHQAVFSALRGETYLG